MIRSQRRRPAPALLWAVVLATLALLFAAMRVWAISPVLTQTSTWYDYQAEVGFDWTAQVTPGHYYPDATVRPEALFQQKLPVDPPQYRRVLLSPLAHSITVRVPYRFTADRPADLSLSLTVETNLLMPGYWQQSRVALPAKTWQVNDQKVEGESSFTLSLTDLRAELQRARTELGFAVEPLEVEIRPVWQVKAAGLPEPIEVRSAPTFRLLYRETAVEIDEPRTEKVGKSLTAEQRITQQLSLGSALLTVRSAQGITLLLLLVAGAVLGFLLWRRFGSRRQALADQIWLRRLQPFIIQADRFQPPAELAIAEVHSLREMARLHQQTGQPIVQAGESLYLRDGGLCYAYRINPGPTSAAVVAAVTQDPEEPD